MSALTEFLTESFLGKNKNRSFDVCGKYRTFSWKYYEIYNISRKLASFLTRKGIKRDSKIIIKSPNSPQWVAAFVACLKMGFTVVPIDYKSDFDFEQSVVASINPELILYSKENETFREITELIRVYNTERIGKETDTELGRSYNKEKPPDKKLEPEFNYSSFGSDPENSYVELNNKKIRIILIDDLESIVKNYDFEDDYYEKIAINDDSLAEVVFTSGSTSRPKGVMLSHKNISSNLMAARPVVEKWKVIFNLIINLRLLSLVPLSHMYGQVIGIFIPLMIGSSVVFLNSINPEEILRAIKKEKIWILGALPKLISMIKNYIVIKYKLNTEAFGRKYKRLRNVRWWIRFPLFLQIKIKIGWRFIAIISGGSAIDFETEDFFRCLGYSIFQGYGLTETAPMITLTDPSKNKEGSVGSFLNGQEVRIVDGEIYIKGENVSSGYYESENPTEITLQNGWFKTGDIAEVDSSGDVFIKGRVDDLIVRPDGLNIYPYDVENAIKSASNMVKDCVVFGIEVENMSEGKKNIRQEIHAVLLMDFKAYPETGKKEAGEIIMRANCRLNPYQKVDSFSIWSGSDFPRTSTLKPKKTEIKRIILEKLKTESKSASDKEQKADSEKFIEAEKAGLYNLINSFHKITEMDINNKTPLHLQDDLGFDSLDIIELTCAIEEKFKIEPGTLNITKDTDLEELEELVKNQPGEIHKMPFFNFPYKMFFVILRTISQFILFPFISILYRKRYKGREFLRNLKRPTVFISNHVSLIDTFVILFSLPLKIRSKLTTVMSIEYHFLNYFKGTGTPLRRFFEAIGFYIFVCFFLNVIPLSRTHGFKQSFENIGTLIDRGWNVLIFPEGSITLDGNIKPFEAGIGIIAKDMKVPIVPVRIDGLHDILHNGILPLGHLPRVPLIRVSFGRQIEIKNGGYQEIAKNLREIVINL
ncbi:AMP-binding protein [bacterium]|nr:AMP-binding protein [bacterium]